MNQQARSKDQRTLITEDDIYLFNEGSHLQVYEKLGSHIVEGGTSFAVWAPNAERISIVGDFNDWQVGAAPMKMRGNSGIWEAFVPGVAKGACYKYHIESRYHMYKVDKADPYAVYAEIPPKTASRVWDLDYTWSDDEWLRTRGQRNSLTAPVSIYEMHLGSWMRVPEEGGRPLSYRELAPKLADYVSKLGFTHVEFMPIMEHPFTGSWGYQLTGYFAPTSRFGSPQDFMFLIDTLHQRGIGVILDWVPSHFCKDEHGLAYFDGTHLYEHSDSRKGWHPDWDSMIFNYGRNEVRSFLLSNAIYWLDKYHIDGLRIDAVASMLYLDYSRKNGDWIPNQYGGKENIEAIDFLRRLNAEVYKHYPDVQTIAEESTAWGMVSRPTYVGGLGFGLKWDMGWMHDTLLYMSKDPVFRRFHHNDITFRMLYAFHENFVLPLSHDEIVHGKGSLIRKMPGDDWQKFANLRTLLGYMYSQAGKKLLFMGGEFGQWDEWYQEKSLDWHLLESPLHRGAQTFVGDLNRLYVREPALHELDCDPNGYEWIDANDSDSSALTYLRKGKDPSQQILVAINFTPVPRQGYRVGVPFPGTWREILNSDAREYGGSGMGNAGRVDAEPIPFHGRPQSVNLRLPPLSLVYLKYEG